MNDTICKCGFRVTNLEQLANVCAVCGLSLTLAGRTEAPNRETMTSPELVEKAREFLEKLGVDDESQFDGRVLGQWMADFASEQAREGFWGRACSRLIDERDALTEQVRELTEKLDIAIEFLAVDDGHAMLVNRVRELTAKFEYANGLVVEWMEAAIKLTAERDRFKTALEHYADEDLWHDGGTYRYERVITGMADHGYTVAQAALKGETE